MFKDPPCFECYFVCFILDSFGGFGIQRISFEGVIFLAVYPMEGQHQCRAWDSYHLVWIHPALYIYEEVALGIHADAPKPECT